MLFLRSTTAALVEAKFWINAKTVTSSKLGASRKELIGRCTGSLRLLDADTVVKESNTERKVLRAHEGVTTAFYTAHQSSYAGIYTSLGGGLPFFWNTWVIAIPDVESKLN